MGILMSFSEETVQNHARLFLAKVGCHAWRNNVGVLPNPHTGTPVRFGLANESKQQNKKIKSSDIIGITPVKITPEMVGRTLGVFTAVEVKKEGWKQNPNNEHEKAQEKYHEIVRESGGFAGFAQSVNDVAKILGMI